jgi:hypothetical protein
MYQAQAKRSRSLDWGLAAVLIGMPSSSNAFKRQRASASPLMHAISLGCGYEAIEALMIRGGFIREEIESGRAVVAAVLAPQPMVMLTLLRPTPGDLTKCINMKLLDNDESTPLHLCCLISPIKELQMRVELLLSLGADPMRLDKHGRTPLDILNLRSPEAKESKRLLRTACSVDADLY